MKVFLAEFLRLIRKPIFFCSAVLTAGALWIGMGTDARWLLSGSFSESQWLLDTTFKARANVLSLPLLSALPSAASVWQELSGGSVKNVLFRSGRREYLCSRTAVLPIVSFLSQLLGILLFLILVGALTRDSQFPLRLILPRLVLTMIFALSGGIGAVLAQDSACAYVIPVTLCFTLTMLKSRFLFNMKVLDPVALLSGEAGTLPGLLFLLLLFFFGFFLLLRKEIKRHV